MCHYFAHLLVKISSLRGAISPKSGDAPETQPPDGLGREKHGQRSWPHTTRPAPLEAIAFSIWSKIAFDIALVGLGNSLCVSFTFPSGTFLYVSDNMYFTFPPTFPATFPLRFRRAGARPIGNYKETPSTFPRPTKEIANGGVGGEGRQDARGNAVNLSALPEPRSSRRAREHSRKLTSRELLAIKGCG